ncbi:MAG: NADP-dependent oxidoreductase [Actinomycetota bacterium]
MTESKETMRAWAIDGYGAKHLRLQQLPVPEVGPTDVLIRMHGAEVGNWDALVRDGEWKMERPFPVVLGLAGAGTVAAAGVRSSRFSKGDHVYVYNYPLTHERCPSPDHNGAFAEYMLAPLAYVAPAPSSLDLVRAGAIPIAGLTALETMTAVLEVHRGDVVLITPASGGVGHVAVQLAKHFGAHVVATASTRNCDFVRSLGADTVVDYTKGDVVEAVLASHPHGVDKILSGVSGESANELVRALRKGGRMVDLNGEVTAKAHGVHVETEYVVQADVARLTRLARLIDDQVVRLTIEELVPFERVGEAIERAAEGHVRGKLAISIRR